MSFLEYEIKFSIKRETLEKWRAVIERRGLLLVIVLLSAVSVLSFNYYFQNGLGIAYNDARSHLDIGRRVVEGLSTGLAQLGSVWLPLTHFLMILTVWNDFMWHSGLAGAIQSMVAFVGTGVLIYLFLKELRVGILGRFVGVLIFVANLNILYLQSTAMTELALLGTMTAGAYYSLLWYKNGKIINLIQAALWVMLSTLVRYDGWFLFFFAASMLFVYIWFSRGFKMAEGMIIMFSTLAGLGIGLWFLWNLFIFKDPFYFIFGPYSAYAQQSQLESAGVLASKNNWFLSAAIYIYALAYNSGALTMVLGFLGAVVLWMDKRLSWAVRMATIILMAPMFFNILALYLGHSVLYIPAFSGNTWFNVRYGIMMMPSFAIFAGYLIDRAVNLRFVLVGIVALATAFSFLSSDAVTIDDALIGSSQKNVSEVSGWLRKNAKDKPGFVLISAASHDSVIFSSGLPMKKFIHEGTGVYYEAALSNPDQWARWIVMRSYSDSDSTWVAMKSSIGFKKFKLVDHYPFADVYQLDDKYLGDLNTEPTLKQK